MEESMQRINIANYLIGEMSDGFAFSPNVRHRQIIDTLVDNWDKNQYLTPQHSSAAGRIVFNKINHIG